MVLQCQFAFQTRERLRDRRRYIFRSLFVPSAMDLKLLPLPDALYPMYSCMRPFRLAWNAWRGHPRCRTSAMEKRNP
jgi:hypothetical protein